MAGYERSLGLYLQLARKAYPGGEHSLRLVSATTNRPTTREPESVVVKVVVKVPNEAFDPKKDPVATVTVPLEALSPATDAIEVQADEVDL